MYSSEFPSAPGQPGRHDVAGASALGTLGGVLGPAAPAVAPAASMAASSYGQSWAGREASAASREAALHQERQARVREWAYHHSTDAYSAYPPSYSPQPPPAPHLHSLQPPAATQHHHGYPRHAEQPFEFKAPALQHYQHQRTAPAAAAYAPQYPYQSVHQTVPSEYAPPAAAQHYHQEDPRAPRLPPASSPYPQAAPTASSYQRPASQPSIIQFNPQHASVQQHSQHSRYSPQYTPQPQPSAAASYTPRHQDVHAVHAYPQLSPALYPSSVQPAYYPAHQAGCACASCRPQPPPQPPAPDHSRAPPPQAPQAPQPRVDVPAMGAASATGACVRPSPSEGPPAKRMRTDRVETVSPVDLSVRTVRRSADSTAWHDVDLEPEPDDCDSTAMLQPLQRARHASPAPAPAPRQRRTAVMPRMHFMPDFSVAQFYQRAAPAPPLPPPPRSRSPPLPPQVSLPRVSTLPWPSALALPTSHAVPLPTHHSSLLPRYSSNRSSLYPSSSAPALPAASGYLLDGLPAPPTAVATAPTVPVPSSAPFSAPSLSLLSAPAPAPSPRSPLPNVPAAPDGPARIRTKAEMKMLGDAAAEAVRSWLASSSPQAAEPVEPPCVASTTGIGLEPGASPQDGLHLNSSEDTMYHSAQDPVRAAAPVAAQDPVQGPVQDSGEDCATAATAALSVAQVSSMAPAEGSAAPEAAVVSSSATLCGEEPIASSVAVAPVFKPLLAGTSTAVESDDSQGAWAESCRDFEKQLGATNTCRSPKKQLRQNIQKQSKNTCDNNFNKKLSSNLSVSIDASESHKVFKPVQNVSSTAESVVKDKTLLKISRKQSIKRNTSLNQLIKNEPDSDASEEASAVIDEDCASSSSDKQSLRSVRTRSLAQRLSGKETVDKRGVSNRSQSSVEVVKSPTRRSKTSGKEDSPDKILLNELIDLKSVNNAGCSAIAQPFEDENPEQFGASQAQSVKIRLRTKIVEVERVCLRPKGDGSDFRPGWEEEVFQYKRSLRMPPVLINMSKRFSHLDMDCPKSPSINSANDSAANSSLLKQCSTTNSEIDVISTCLDLESEDALSSSSQPVSVTSKMGGLRRSIVDKLVEKVSKTASRNKNETFKLNEIAKMKAKPQSTPKSKVNEPCTSNRDSNSNNETNKKQSTSKVAGDFIKSVFGSEKAASPKTKSNVLENKKGKVKTVPIKRKPERLPVRQISLRKRILVIPKTTNGKQSKKLDGTQNEGIVLRPRNVQQGSNTRPGMRSAALIRRSKVVLNSKQQKNTIKTEPDIKETAMAETKKISIDDENALGKDSLDSQPVVVRKRVRLRRKFRSGFDYIRKKKRVRKENVKKVEVVKEKIVPVVARTPLTEEQIQVTLRNWVINRSHGDTVLHRAARLGYAEIAEYAIDKLHVSPRAADNAGYTPLHEAARRGHVELSKILLENGADVSCSATGGIRPLHEAAESNEVEMVRLLLEYGADPTLATYADETPLSIVESDSAAHELLLSHLADVQGLPGPPWKFHGPSKMFDPVTFKGDLALQSPPAVESDSESEIDMFCSEVTPPPLYIFCDEPSSQCWVLIKDLMEVLNISTEEEMMQLLNGIAQDKPTSSLYQNEFIRTREVTVEEFLQQTATVTFSAPLVNLPVSGCNVCLVEFNCRVRELLNEETTTLV